MTTENYIKKINEQITKDTRKAAGFENTHNILSITGIVLSASVAAVLGVGASTGINLGILIASVSCSAASCAVLLTDRIYDFEAKAIQAKYRKNALSKELHLYEMKAGIYKDNQETLLVERCEEIMNH